MEWRACTAGDSRCASCQSEGVVRLNAGTDGGFIGSVVVDERQDDDGCGTSRCPWIISGRPGQVSLVNLSPVHAVHSNCLLHGCVVKSKLPQVSARYAVDSRVILISHSDFDFVHTVSRSSTKILLTTTIE